MYLHYLLSPYSTKSDFNPLSAKFIKWSNTLKQFVGKLPTNCLSVFGHFVGLALKGLNQECQEEVGIRDLEMTFLAASQQPTKF